MNAETLGPSFGRKLSIVFPVVGLLFMAGCASMVYLTGDYGTVSHGILAGKLLLAAGTALVITCIVSILRKQTPDSDFDMDKEARSVQRTLILLLLNLPVAVFCYLAFGWISKWPLCVVTLTNASGKDMTQVEVMEPYGKESVWVTLSVSAGEEMTARFPLKKFSGEGDMSLYFNVGRSSHTCMVKGNFSPSHPGRSRVNVKPDFTCD